MRCLNDEQLEDDYFLNDDVAMLDVNENNDNYDNNN